MSRSLRPLNNTTPSNQAGRRSALCRLLSQACSLWTWFYFQLSLAAYSSSERFSGTPLFASAYTLVSLPHHGSSDRSPGGAAIPQVIGDFRTNTLLLCRSPHVLQPTSSTNFRGCVRSRVTVCHIFGGWHFCRVQTFPDWASFDPGHGQRHLFGPRKHCSRNDPAGTGCLLALLPWVPHESRRPIPTLAAPHTFNSWVQRECLPNPDATATTVGTSRPGSVRGPASGERPFPDSKHQVQRASDWPFAASNRSHLQPHPPELLHFAKR